MSFEVLFFLIFAGGWIFGRLAEFIKLPAVLGMTLWGIGLGGVTLFLGQGWPSGFWELVPFIKSLALVIILLRAGLGLSRKELQNAGLAAILMTFVPCILEGMAVMGLLIWLFGWSWEVAGLTGFMLAAVSPAVVVPSMLDLKSRGLGIKNGVITIVLAGASADDVFAITFFTIFLGLATAAGSSPWEALAFMPLTLILGVALGLVLGLALSWWFRKNHASIRATEKALLLLASSVFLVQVGNWVHAAALLGVMTLGLVLVERVQPVAHELAGKMGKVWIFAQIALFVIIGMSLEPAIALDAGPKALAVIGLGL
ncbi:MAG: peptidase, partial [Spirochaetes bacterium GWB1_48_6]